MHRRFRETCEFLRDPFWTNFEFNLNQSRTNTPPTRHTRVSARSHEFYWRLRVFAVLTDEYGRNGVSPEIPVDSNRKRECEKINGSKKPLKIKYRVQILPHQPLLKPNWNVGFLPLPVLLNGTPNVIKSHYSFSVINWRGGNVSRWKLFDLSK